MLPTFVIGLREGLEASLIIGIVAAFLRRQGGRGALRSMWLGVGTAILLCVAAGVALDVLARDLPQRQQEGLETVIGVAAVVMVTYMVVWMKNNSRGLKGSLESAADSALVNGSTMALVAMAFLAVLREGLETVVFLLAAFNASGSVGPAVIGALLGIAVAVALGYGIYRGGVRINLSRFFRATGVVLALVAAGLVVSALHTAHEAGWVNIGQQQTFDLTWLAEPGTVRASLLTGVLGIQPRPTLIEVIGWLVYLVPVLVIVLWPPTWSVPRRVIGRTLGALAGAAVIGAAVLVLVAPARPDGRAGDLQTSAATWTAAPGDAAALVGAAAHVTRTSGTVAVTVESATATRLTVTWSAAAGDSTRVALTADGHAVVNGVDATVYTASGDGPGAATNDLVENLSLAELIRASHGRLPLGVNTTTATGRMPVSYSSTSAYRVAVDPAIDIVLDAEQTTSYVAALTLPEGTPVMLGEVVTEQSALTSEARADAAAASSAAATQSLRHTWMSIRGPVSLLALAGVLIVVSRRLLRQPFAERAGPVAVPSTRTPTSV